MKCNHFNVSVTTSTSHLAGVFAWYMRLSQIFKELHLGAVHEERKRNLLMQVHFIIHFPMVKFISQAEAHISRQCYLTPWFPLASLIPREWHFIQLPGAIWQGEMLTKGKRKGESKGRKKKNKICTQFTCIIRFASIMTILEDSIILAHCCIPTVVPTKQLIHVGKLNYQMIK